jgi:hypothetical protein
MFGGGRGPFRVTRKAKERPRLKDGFGSNLAGDPELHQGPESAHLCHRTRFIELPLPYIMSQRPSAGSSQGRRRFLAEPIAPCNRVCRFCALTREIRTGVT